MNRAGSSLCGELESELRRSIAAWFPLTIDRDYGGFLCDFDYRWRAAGSHPKMLEFQARQTITAALAATHCPDLPELRDAALNGVRCLKDTMWDPQYGGWHQLLDRRGQPSGRAVKHGHGTGYGLSACAAAYEATGERESLALGELAFAWLEEHAHDDEHGGYFVFYRQDGTPILTLDDAVVAPGEIRDVIGTPIGFKDANTTCDLLKGFTDLYREWPDVLLRKRLEELLCIVRDRLVAPPGLVHMYAHRDWVPLPDLARYGQIIRSASIMAEASEALYDAIDPTTARVSKSMIDTMLRFAWDRESGAFHLAGSSFGPDSIEGVGLLVRNKLWWVQADALKALLLTARLNPAERDVYVSHAVRLWKYVKDHVIDAKYGGWRRAGLDTNPEAKQQPKATSWKDASHETIALVDSIEILSSF